MTRLTFFLFICMSVTGMAFGCGGYEFLQIIKGVSTEIVTDHDEVALGQPVTVKLKITNNSEKPIKFDLQGIRPYEFLIKDAKGKTIPCIAPSKQTMANFLTLKAGEKKIVETIDLFKSHAICKTGTFTVSYKGDDGAFGQAYIPSSKGVAITLKKGKVSKHRQMIGLFSNSIPKRWNLTGGRENFDADLGLQKLVKADELGFWFLPPSGLKKDVVSISLLRTDAKVPAELIYNKVEYTLVGEHKTLGRIYARIHSPSATKAVKANQAPFETADDVLKILKKILS